MAKLIQLLQGIATTIELTGDDLIIGRLGDCGLQIHDGLVSRKHARIFKKGQTYFVEDLGSFNGTIINARKIEGSVALKNEMQFKIGPAIFRFEDFAELRPHQDPVVARNLAAAATGGTLKVEVDDDEGPSHFQTSHTTGLGTLNVNPEAKLKAVLEISRALAGAVELDLILPKILDALFQIFPFADRGCVLIMDKALGKMVPRATKHRRSNQDETVKLSRTILRKVLEEKTGILSGDAPNDPRFNSSESIHLLIRSMMCVPLIGLDGIPIGVINIDSQNTFNQFTEGDLDLLMVVAGQAAMCYEQANLLVTAMEKQKQDKEMQIASEVQRSLLPTALPQISGWEFFASYDSAQEVGGDYYDAFFVDGGKKVCLAFGDVAGKGVPASLIMSRIATIVTNVMAFVGDVQEAVQRINHQMCTRAVDGRFVTFILCVIDVTSGEMTIAIAGHMPMMIRKNDGTIVEFGDEIVGVPIGVIDDFPYEIATRVILPGETCVIYTDGVSEAMNPANDLYGVDRLRQRMQQSTGGNAEELGQVILDDVRQFADGRAQNDDITIMVFGRK